MFKRREKTNLLSRIREFIWPSTGWVRWARYHSHRVGRMKDSSYKVAAGIASGVAVSFTPFIGFHILLAVTLAYVIRGNILAAVVGTVIGNPWTFPFIFVLIYQVGAFISGADTSMPLSDILASDRLWGNPLVALEPVLTPMIHGGFIVAPIMWWATYVIARVLVEKYQVRREERLRLNKAARMDRLGDTETTDGNEDDRT